MSWPLVFALIFGVCLVLPAVLIIVRGFRVGNRAEWKCDEGVGTVVGGFFLLLVGLGLTLGMSLGTLTAQVSCERYGRELGVVSHWQLIGGCYVEVPNQGRLVPQSWIVPVVEGNRMRIDINAPGGASPTETTVASEGLIVIPNPNGDGSFIVVPQG